MSEVKYRVTLIESERGWGSSSWTEDYSTLEAAEARIEEINSANTAPVAPAYYVRAETRIEAVRAGAS